MSELHKVRSLTHKPIAILYRNSLNIESAYSGAIVRHIEAISETLEQCSTYRKFKPAIWCGDNEREG